MDNVGNAKAVWMLSWNNGLAYELHSDSESAHIRAGNMDLSEYRVDYLTRIEINRFRVQDGKPVLVLGSFYI